MAEPSSPEPVKNIVLVGCSGNGKSATGNSLLGSNLFTSKKQVTGFAERCKMFRAAKQDGPVINVIDTPGLFDLGASADYISKEIKYCLSMAEEGIHAVLFVLSAMRRITQEEEATLNALQGIFESKILDYFIVVFTGGDVLEYEGETLDEYLQTGCPPFLTNVLRLCGGRKILFDNKTNDKDKKAEQLKQLYALIADVEKQTGGKPYTDNMRRTIKKENDKVRKQEMEMESKNLAEAELAAMKEKLRLEHEKNTQTMTLAVENALKHSAETHEKEIRKMIEELQKGQQHQVENALKQCVETLESEIRRMREELQQGQHEQMENALKQSAETQEREMRKMKEEPQKGHQHQVDNALKQRVEAQESEIRRMREELQQGQLHRVENALKQSAEIHEREMRIIREEIQQHKQHPLEMRPPIPSKCECNIM